MSNPLFQALGGGQNPGAMGELLQLKQRFQQFKAGFQGNPKAEVERLLQSGQMSQQELNQLQSMAQQFGHLFQ